MEPTTRARATVPRARRAYAMTAPPGLLKKSVGESPLKRGAPTIWELQESMAAHQAREATEQAETAVGGLPRAPATWGRAHGRAATTPAGGGLPDTYRDDISEDSESCPSRSDSEAGRDKAASSSWPRVRKQRTVEGAMSLWEVSEALERGEASPSTSLDAKTLDDVGPDLSFVDSMFLSQSPTMPPSAPVSVAREDSMGVTALGARGCTPSDTRGMRGMHGMRCIPPRESSPPPQASAAPTPGPALWQAST